MQTVRALWQGECIMAILSSVICIFADMMMLMSSKTHCWSLGLDLGHHQWPLVPLILVTLSAMLSS